MEPSVPLALGLTVCAGLATGVGSLLVYFARTPNTRVLSVALGFSAGVMVFVSFAEILPEGTALLVEPAGRVGGTFQSWIAFFVGMIGIAIIDRLVPERQNPHAPRAREACERPEARDRLMRVGIVAAAAIWIHNFPEGMATFASALEHPEIGVTIALAVAIHNIPEGIAVSMPVLYATGSRKRALVLSALSGLSEPVGALVGYGLIRLFVPLEGAVLGWLLSSVAGIMVFVSLDELLPSAREYDTGHLAIYGLISGMIVMAGSLLGLDA
ncbi:MAG: zinc transporter ZupT [Deltaproteobacteria bacterium]|nr:zinc transporter ZupT [Deltaproteobacteria bacterium]